jgi:excisionase family DNA binding protein
MKQQAKQYYSVNELAQVLGLSRIAVFKKIKAGRIPATKVGRAYVVLAADVVDLVGKEVGEAGRRTIDTAVKKVVHDYGEALRLLGSE